MSNNSVKQRFSNLLTLFAGILLGAAFFGGFEAFGHCDTLGGPVIVDARSAIETGDVTPVLKWVSNELEQEIKIAFEQTLAVRKLSPEAMQMSDMYFFETLVRLHRLGEGAPYTGLKPEGEIEPPIAAADLALETGSVEELIEHVQQEVALGIRDRFDRAVMAGAQKDESVELGREYVEAYVIYVHYIEGLHTAIGGGSEHHTE